MFCFYIKQKKNIRNFHNHAINCELETFTLGQFQNDQNQDEKLIYIHMTHCRVRVRDHSRVTFYKSSIPFSDPKVFIQAI